VPGDVSLAVEERIIKKLDLVVNNLCEAVVFIIIKISCLAVKEGVPQQQDRA
jgi:hypothetical protein